MAKTPAGAKPGLRRWTHSTCWNIWGPSRPICLDNVFDRPPAYGAAGVDLLLQLQAAVVAQTHVSAGVNDCVHLLVEADGAFSIFASGGQLRDRQGGRDGRTERGAGSSHWKHTDTTNVIICFTESVIYCACSA